MSYTIKVVDKLVRKDSVIFSLEVPETLSLAQDGDAVENFVAVHPYGLVIGGLKEKPVAGSDYEFPETAITVKIPDGTTGTITLDNDTEVGATFTVGT